MTFFLNSERIDYGALTVPDPGPPPPGLWGGISAAFAKEQIESDANMRAYRLDREEREAQAREAITGVDDSLIQQWIEQQRGMPASDAEAARTMILSDPRGVDFILRQNPAFSDEAVTERVNERLKKEHDDARETLAVMGAGRTVAEFLGAAGGMMADWRNLPFLIVGGGTGSIARIMGREALLNAAAEAVTMPSRFEMAERLELPEPNVLQQLSIAAAGGAIFGGAVEGLARGIGYFRGTRTVPSGRVAAFDVEANIDRAEDLIATGRPLDDYPATIREQPPARAAEPPADAPPARAESIRAPTPAAPLQRLSEATRAEPAASLFDTPEMRGAVGERQVDLEDLIAESRAAEVSKPVTLSKAIDLGADDPLPRAVERRLQSEAGGERPLIRHMQQRYGGVHPASRLAEELKAIGVTQRTAPGLFRNTGRRGFDNIPAADEPHLAAMLGEDGNGYLDEGALASFIAEEVSGQPMPVTREQLDARVELNERRRAQAEMERAVSAGRQLDEELTALPHVPGWDDPKFVEAVDGHGMQDLRARAVEDDRLVDMGDGRGERPLSSVLDELDADADFADVIQLCGRTA